MRGYRSFVMADQNEMAPTTGDIPVDTDLVDTTESDRGRRKRNPWVEWAVVIAVALTAALLVRAFVLQQFEVDGQSMINTLHDGDRVLVNKLSYRLHDPRRGDVVVLETIDGGGERDLIKRVVAIPGDAVEYRSCTLYIGGRAVTEPYLDPDVVTSSSCGAEQSKFVVPDHHVFVLGDNRAGSKDSRDSTVGAIDYDDIIGRAFVIIWPTSDWAWL